MKKLLLMIMVGFTLAAAPLTTDQQHLVTLLMNTENGSKVLQDLKEGSAGLTDEAIIQHVKNYISDNLGITDPDKITKVESNLVSLLDGKIDALTLPSYTDVIHLYDLVDYLHIPESTLQPLQERLISEFVYQAVDRVPQSETVLKSALESFIKTQSSKFIPLIQDFNAIKDQMVSLLSLDKRGTLVSQSELDNKLKELNEKWSTYTSHLNTAITSVTKAAELKGIDVSNMKEVIKVGMISPMIEQLTPVFDSLKEVSNRYIHIRAAFFGKNTLAVIIPPATPFFIIKAITAIIYEFVDLIKIKLGMPLSLSYSNDRFNIFPEDATLAGTGEALDRIEQAGEQLEKIVVDLQHAMATIVQKPVSAGRLEQSSDSDIIDQPIEKAPVVSHDTTVTVQPDAATKVTTDLQAQLPGIKQFIDDLDANERQNENTIIEQISRRYPFNKNEITLFRSYIKNGTISSGEHNKILTLLTARPDVKPFMAERDIAISGEATVYEGLKA